MSFRCPVGEVPIAVLDRVRSRLRDISDTLAAVSSSDSFWSSVAESPLYVDIEGWRFRYSIDRLTRQFIVLEAVRVSDVLPDLPVPWLYKKRA